MNESQPRQQHMCTTTFVAFVWSGVGTATWKEMYERLVVAYKKDHKDTILFRKGTKKDPKLGNWVKNQHDMYKQKKMTEERKQLVDSIGLSVICQRKI